MTFIIKPLAFAGVVSFIVCGMVLATRRWHDHLTVDFEHGVQKVHTSPTPRVGGLGIVCGLVAAWVVEMRASYLMGSGQLFGYVLLACLPAFVAGLLEDLTKKVSVYARLSATMLSGGLVYILCGYGVTRVEIPFVDSILAASPMLSFIFTAFAVAGVANAYNIIDGFNGLASVAMIFAILALLIIAHNVGDNQMAYIGTILIAAILGFMIWNYPLGRIFMGDGGAYALGFIIAWLAVMLPTRNPEVSPWASLMACGYPIMETIYTMIRRVVNRQKAGAPDALHLHSLVEKTFIQPRFQKFRSVIVNSMVTLALLPFIFLMALASVLFYRDTDILICTFITFFLFYVTTHHALYVSHASSESRR